MIQKIKSYLLIMSSMLMLAVPALVPTIAASAACNNIGNKIADGANGAIGNGGGGGVSCTQTNVGDSDIAKIAKGIVNILSVVVGAIAIIMIIIGGFRYITSGGDSNRVGGAKNTLIYAIVGLIIVALAQLIVHFVLGQTSTIQQ